MKPKVLVLALLTAATALPASARAADDFCSRIFIYAINQICHLLPNGQTLCQPVALAGPGPSCDSPSARQLVQIPFGPPTIQMSPYSPFAPAANPAMPNPFAANPFAANAYPPFPFAPNLFGPNTYAPKAYAPAALPPVVAAPVKPVAVIEPAPAAPAEKPLAKLMPATAPTGSAAAVTSVTPPVPAAKAAEPLAALPPYGTGVPLAGAAPKTAEPVKAAAAAASPVASPAPEPKATQAPAAAPPLAALPTPAATPTTRPDAAPAVAIAAPIAVTAPIAVIAVPAVDPEAAAKAEIARVQAEKAIEDALAHFEFDSAELTPVGRAMLDTWLAQAPGDAPIVVTGHADRLGPEPYNDKLSLLRAEAVKKYLTEKGKPAHRIQILAKGEAMPVISCAGDVSPATKACLAPNRRAEIVVKPVAKPSAKAATKPVAKSTSKHAAKPIAKPIKSKSAR